MLKNLFRNEILEQNFTEAVDLFNESDLKSSYEILFELWRDTKRPNRKLFFQAILQLNASLQLLEKHKFAGAKRVYLSALKKLMPFAAMTKPLNIKKLYFDVSSYFDQYLQNYDSDFGPELIDVKLVDKPKLCFNFSSKESFQL